MDHLHKLTLEVREHLLFMLLADNALLLAGWWIGSQIYHIEPLVLLVTLTGVSVVMTILFAVMSAVYLTQPVQMLWQAILHIAPDVHNVPAPKLESARLGRELVVNLVRRVYQLASGIDGAINGTTAQEHTLHTNPIANLLPLPLIVLDKDQTITFLNEPAQTFINVREADAVGKNLYSILDMSFQSEQTFDAWLAHAMADTVTTSQTWSRVRLKLADQTTIRQFDLAAHYSKANPTGIETLLILFDHSEQYGQDDQAMSFVALAVHELRTPLTLLRGYIEVFEEELDGKLDAELTDFMHKMQTSAQQLSSFVNNILNVSRIEADTLTLELHETSWSEVLEAAIRDMSLRATVRGINIETHIAPDLPTVAIDRVSIYEVITNLIDNAIKYSGTSKKIVVSSNLTTDGMVETSVQDFGVGIAANLMSHLFTKFYRDHRHRAQIGGTGLGLYLSKAIVSAHRGNIWVRSKEGVNTTFSFTVLPYARLADQLKNQDNTDIERQPHGWIKNHSLYRR